MKFVEVAFTAAVTANTPLAPLHPDDVAATEVDAGDWTTARYLNRRFFRLMQSLFLEPSPAPAKAALHLMGSIEEKLRLPLVEATPTTRQTLQTILTELGLLRDAPKENNLRVF